MKQKLLNKLWLRATMLVALMCVAFTNVWAEEVTDVLNRELTGVSGTTYSSWSGKTATSSAVYAGQSAGGNESIQLRSNNNNSGVVTTASGGKVKKITVDWQSATSNGRTLNVYGKNSAYSEATDLYNSTNQGTLIGTIVCGTSTELTVDEDYEYIGFRSASGAMYLTSVSIVWETGGSGGDVTPTCATPTFSPAAGTYTTAQSVAISTTTEGATIYYTVDGSDPTVESTVYTEAITVSETTTIKAFAAKEGCNSSAVASATYTIVSIEHAGTVDDPYTVADARTAIDAGTGITGVYATGIVSKIVTAFNPTYGNISYNISADGTEEADQLQAYRGFSYDGAWFTSADDIQVGDVVVVYGNLTKYGSTYEFAANNQLVSLDRPVVTTPTITVDPTSLTGFTYEVENGPSEAQSILISGSNLTTQISAALDDNSNFEFSFSEDGDYFSDSSIGIAPEISTLRVYVRMKADLAVGEYSGTITLTSEDAETVTVALAGSVTAPEAANFVWDLSIDQTVTATEEEMTWESDYATMAVNKGGASTKTNNYYPGTEGKTYTSTRFYKNSGLIITPALGYEITSVVFEATSESYASALKNSEWTNATATVSGTTVTVTPTDGSTDFYAVIGGTCGFTSVKVYYQELSLSIIANIGAAGYATYVTEDNVSFPEGVEAYITSEINTEQGYVLMTQVTAVPKGTPVVLKGEEGTYTLDIAAGELDDVTGNLLKASDGAVVGDGTQYILAKPEGKEIGFYKAATGVSIAAGKAYLEIPGADVKGFTFFFGDEATGLSTIDNGKLTIDNEIYNLAGQRIQKMQRGINIVNGKKIAIK